MNDQTVHGKRILVVDDEPDVLDTVTEVLASAHVVTAGSFDEARERITTEPFDLVILDIMGVNGFALLEACRANRLPAAMLTAHAINVESLNLAIKLGAVSFLPKEELHRLPELVAEILEGLEQGRSHWARLFQRLAPFFKEKLGVLWEDLDKSKFPPTYY
jgi:DNA-binding NtrC family response regulator